MIRNPRIYEPALMAQIAELFSDVVAAYAKFEPKVNSRDQPLYVFSTEIVIRHYDGYTIGRIGMDDFPFFEFTDENYGEKPKRDDGVGAAVQAHIRQENTASGQPRAGKRYDL